MNRYAERREKVFEGLRRDGVSALLDLSAANIRYLTGFTGDSSWILLLAEGRALILSDGRFTTQLAEECPEIEAVIRPIGQPIAEGAGDLVHKLGPSRVEFAAAVMTVDQFETIRKGSPTTEWINSPGRVERLRMIKDEAEIALIRASIAAAEAALAATLPTIAPDSDELSVAARLEWELAKAGAESPSFPSIVAAGPRAALPHARPAAGSLVRAGEMLLIDWGATRAGYKSDLTRVFATGKVTSRLELIHRTVSNAQARAVAAIRPGTLARDVDAEARSVIDEAGFGPYFTHSVGHAFGLEIHEAPVMRSQADVELQPGMVLTVEPGIYLPGWGGVRIEDDVLVTESGVEILTRFPKSLDETLLPFS